MGIVNKFIHILLIVCQQNEMYPSSFKRLSQNSRKGDSNVHDALIGEAALTYQLELITGDGLLAQIVKDLGGNAFSLRDQNKRQLDL